jgi:polyphosphate kinase 2 (PPK2 family)
MIGIFNRSHYEDVLAVRVHQLVPEAVWSRRFAQINDFERLLADSGVTILKFLLQISREEQRQRLLKRLDDPRRNWKFNPHDLEERRCWDDYTAAYQDVLSRCSPEWAPWFVVPADRKPARDVLIAETVVRTLERMNPEPPAADAGVIRQGREMLGSR